MTAVKWTAPQDAALIIVDVQNGFCPGGNLAVEGGDEIVPDINDIAAQFGVVIMTQDFHPAGHSSFASSHEDKAPFDVIEMDYGPQVLWPDHCVQGTPDADFHPDLLSNLGEKIDGISVLQKGTNPAIDSYSGFQENDMASKPRFANGETLEDTLNAIDTNTVVLVGLAYDFCVGYHALDAKEAGFDVIVVKDATRAISMPTPDGLSNTEAEMDKQLADAGVLVIEKNDLPAALEQNWATPKNDNADLLAKPEGQSFFPEKDLN